MSEIQNSAPIVNKGGLNAQAHIVAVICLLVGAAIGYFARGGTSPAASVATTSAQASTPAAPPGMGGMGQGAAPTPDQLRHMADKQAAPLLDELKANPNNAELLAKIGNVYYDTRNFKEAIDYYDRSLKTDPKNANVRTDLGTAYAYSGDADRAIEQFETALKYDPKHGQSLFNRGMVEWQAKGDVKAAVASWERLLKTIPDYPDRARVEQLVAKAKQHTTIKPGTKTDKPAAL